MKNTGRRYLILALSLTWLVLSVTACTMFPWEQRGESLPQPPDPDQVEELVPDALVEEPEEKIFINTLEVPQSAQWDLGLEDIKQLAVGKKSENVDTIGWLRVPNTSIDDVIVYYPDDENDYYLRRDFERRPNNYGTYFVDFRCKFGEDYRWQDLSTNTCIYGHSMEDSPNGWAFSQLKHYLDPDFARENPNLYFSTLGEDLAWEVFAVFYATTEWGYNMPEWPDFQAMLDECLDRSIYNYDIRVTSEDKILTLSTCCYNFVSSYPNKYRFVIMARLIQPGETLSETATFSVNPSPKGPELR